MSMALFSASQAPTHLPSLPPAKPHLIFRPSFSLTLKPKKNHIFVSISTRAIENGAGAGLSSSTATVTVEDSETPEQKVPEASEVTPAEEAADQEESLGSNGSPAATAAAAAVASEAPSSEAVTKFQDPKWVNGTWDLKQFQKNGETDWDAVIDAEAKRRKWLEDNPESSSNEDPVIFDTSIIPWWAWMKRFHLPEAELLNGRAAMIGFFMAYFVDSLTGVGLVDQMGNFFCKTLLFVAVAGVLLIRKNEDVENIKKLVEESTFYDKQWQATWQDEATGSSKKE